MSNTLNTKIAVSMSAGEDTLDDGTTPVILEPIVDPPAEARTEGKPEGMAAEAQAQVETKVEGTTAEPEITAVVLPAEAAPSDLRPLGGSSEVRQFIAMLRQERRARTRARRLKRLGWAMGAAAAAAFVAARSNNPDPGALAPELATVAEAAIPPPADPAGVDPAAPSVFDHVDPEPAGTVAPAGASDPGQPADPCEESFAQQRWRAAVETCTKIFEESPGAALALRIAHAHYSRGQTTPAGFWARTALGLGSKDADAFVLIGHSEREAGHTKNAADAYRRYLQSSPRGWHAKRLRAALRELKPRPAAYRPPSVRRRSERTL